MKDESGRLASNATATANSPQLRRSLNLPLLVLYGLGTMIGAGIYVLVGGTAGRAGMYAPMAFIVATAAVAPTAASYAELAARYPVSAGEAAYVGAGFRSQILSATTGLLVIGSGVVASATIALGCAGYLQTFFELPIPLLVAAVIVVMGLVAAWGIMESVLLASLFTLIEAGGLVALIYAGFFDGAELVGRLSETVPQTLSAETWLGIISAAILAVFAFIGFEDMVNVAEETKRPGRNLPLAIFIAVSITMLLYTLVSAVAVLSVPLDELAVSGAPLSLVFERLTGTSPSIISAIAIFATANTVLVQFIMASRVAYGLANQGNLPRLFGQISPLTRTPVMSTAAVVGLALLLGLGFDLEGLAEITSLIVLLIWALANAALLLIKQRMRDGSDPEFNVPFWVPVFGLFFTSALIAVLLFA